jgi:hypothetical protein
MITDDDAARVLRERDRVAIDPGAYPTRMVPAAACVHEYPPGCPAGTTRCWLCAEPEALPPRQGGPRP